MSQSHDVIACARHQERSSLTREALADVDAGHVIEHQAVLAWADSLGTNEPLPLPLDPHRSLSRHSRLR